MHFWDVRRYAHLALLVLMIIGIRACGGATEAEDRLSFVTRWAAERTGLSGAKDRLDAEVRPRLAAATGSMTYTIYAAVSRTMDNAEMAVGGMAMWVRQQVSNAETAIETRIRSIVSPDRDSEPKRPESPPTDKDLTTNLSR
jgi:hypothetical protein